MKKIIAYYLPQFHEFKENNEWWGEGYTEWNNVKSAKPLFKGHIQPRIPIDGYYDLTKIDTLVSQVNLAKKYGVYGFCLYHYWFEGKLLMEKPSEILLENKAININFCFSWANHNFHNKVQFKKRVLLIEQTYGELEDWKRHFDYLAAFFQDKRYIKIKNKPVFILYDAKNIFKVSEMMKYFNFRSKELGFDGIHFTNTLKDRLDVEISSINEFDSQVEYQPYFSNYYNTFRSRLYDFKRLLCKDIFKKPLKLQSNKVWHNIVRSTPKNGVQTFIGAYTSWDTSPRWKERGIIHIGGSKELFRKYMEIQNNRSSESIGDFLFITAWNEWGEGAYLEGDSQNNYMYLEVISELFGNHNNKI